MFAHGGPGELSLTTQTVTFVDSGCSPVSKNGCINRKRAMANTIFFILFGKGIFHQNIQYKNIKISICHSPFPICATIFT